MDPAIVIPMHVDDVRTTVLWDPMEQPEQQPHDIYIVDRCMIVRCRHAELDMNNVLGDVRSYLTAMDEQVKRQRNT